MSSPTKTTKSSGLLTTVAPMIPLAIALAHGALTTGTTTPAAGPLPIPPFTPVASLTGLKCGGGTADSPVCEAPYPMLQKGHPVDWWFVFKFNAAAFAGCGDNRTCPFGGTPQSYPHFGQQFAYASSEAPTLQQGAGCAGAAGASSASAAAPAAAPVTDPIGATFDEVYNGGYHYVLWNDQFYDDPAIKGCSGNGCDSPWGHSKGMLAWNNAGQGFVMQVSTPSWPASGSARFPRKSDGNTLGCVKDNDVEVSQHFFALRLSKDDLVQVLTDLGNASVVTDPGNTQIVSNGGPPDVQQLVAKLGQKSASPTYIATTLSTGVELISKPSNLQVPPWQMVSAVLGGVSLRAATWWDAPQIYSTDGTTTPGCWNSSLGKPGAVDIAISGHWAGKEIGLTGGSGPNFNHAKLGVSTSGATRYAIFGDMNQQGTLSGTNCDSSQNGRGGMFFVVVHPQLADSLSSLIGGASAPTQAPVKAAGK